jgi:hypothetical protein
VETDKGYWILANTIMFLVYFECFFVQNRELNSSLLSARCFENNIVAVAVDQYQLAPSIKSPAGLMHKIYAVQSVGSTAAVILGGPSARKLSISSPHGAPPCVTFPAP